MTNDAISAQAADPLLESVIRITELRDRDTLAASLVATLHELTGASRVVLYKLQADPAGHTILSPIAATDGHAGITEAACHVPTLGLQEHPGHLDCVSAGKPVDDAATGLRLFPVRDGHDKVCGLLEIGGESPADLPLVHGFLRIYRNFLAILDDSERDTLTGLLNRKTFDRNIGRMLASATQDVPDFPPVPDRRVHEHPGARRWLAVMDVDHFKRINDQFGHLYGDEVLLLLARLMQESFRKSDHLFRFGGEEFVLLLEPTEFANALKVLERFRGKVEAFAFPQVGRVTISIGFSAISSGDPTATIIGNADQALYFAKQNGRNQVCSYEQLVEQGKLQSQSLNREAELF